MFGRGYLAQIFKGEDVVRVTVHTYPEVYTLTPRPHTQQKHLGGWHLEVPVSVPGEQCHGVNRNGPEQPQ